MSEPIDAQTVASLRESGPALKLAVNSTRTVHVAQTEQRVRPLLRQVPITRVSDLAPLDPLGFPVCMVTTPLARDLTTHAGKGLDAQSARVSAIMEAIERVSAEAVAGARSGSFLGLQAQLPVVDPVAFDLPSDTSYRPDEATSWVEGFDLLAERPAWLAVDLVVSPPSAGILREVDTNGLASGNTLLEATVHALCEVIERDALSRPRRMRSKGADAREPGAAPRVATSCRHRLSAARTTAA